MHRFGRQWSGGPPSRVSASRTSKEPVEGHTRKHRADTEVGADEGTSPGVQALLCRVQDEGSAHARVPRSDFCCCPPPICDEVLEDFRRCRQLKLAVPDILVSISHE